MSWENILQNNLNFKFYKNNYSLLAFFSIFLFSCSSSNNDNLSEDNTNQQDTTTKVIEARPLNTTNSWSKDIKFNFYDVSLLGIRNFLASPEQHSDSTDSGSGYHNIEAWDSFGNEIIDSIVTSEDLFLADISFNSNNGDFYLITDPHIQNALTNNSFSGTDCSIIRVFSANNEYECILIFDTGRAEPNLKRLSTSLDFSRRTIEWNSQNYGILNAYVNSDLPSNISGGTNSSVTLFFDDLNSAFIATEEGYRNEASVWINNSMFVTFDGPWYLDDGGLYNGNPYKYNFWEIIDGLPTVIYSYECFSCDDSFNFLVESGGKVYTKSKIFSVSNSGTINIKDSAIEFPMSSKEGKIWALDNYHDENTPIEIEEVLNDSINNSSAKVLIISDIGNVNLQRGSGIAPIQYNPINIHSDYLMYLKVFEPKNQISSIEGKAFDVNSIFDLDGGASLSFVNSNLMAINLSEDFDVSNDLIIDYMVNDDTNNHSLIIEKNTISNFINSEYFDGNLKWPSPEPQREGFCVFSLVSNQETCALIEDYDVNIIDLESYDFPQRFDGGEEYPNPNHLYNLLGRALPGVQTIQLINDELAVYFKDSKDNNYYKGSANIDDFLSNGYQSLLIQTSSNTEGDLELIMSLIDITN
jgi:hypothetical protein